MNRPSISLFAALALALVVSQTLWAQDGIITTVDAARSGLKVQWTTQVDALSSGGKIVDIHLDVNEDRSHTFFAISYGSKREIFSEFGLSAFGVPYGTNPALKGMEPGLRRLIELNLKQSFTDKVVSDLTGASESTVAMVRQELVDRVDEAEEAAKMRQEFLTALLKSQNQDVEVKLDKFTLPESSIYVTTTTGYVQAIDADTGLTRWANSVGSRNYPTIGLGASHDHVAVINGSTLYCMAADSGKLLWSQSCRGSAGASPVVSKEFVFVPLVSGRLEAFPIAENGVGSESYVSIGRATSRPLVTEKSVCWATNEGFFTVASNREVISPHYRLRADSAINASGTEKDGILFIGSRDGFAYAIDEERGSLLWEFSTGQRLSQSPIPLGDYIFLITDEQKMFKLYAKSGILAPGWDKPISGVQRFVGASRNKIYVQNPTGQIIAISRTNGSKLGALSSRSTDLILSNYQTDRLYVGNQFGSLQCLREVASEIPMFHADEVVELAAEGQKPAMEKEAGAGEPDPFAGFEDNKKKETKTDPFGAGGDPFADPPKKKDDKKDPFGNDKKKDPNDPFGN